MRLNIDHAAIRPSFEASESQADHFQLKVMKGGIRPNTISARACWVYAALGILVMLVYFANPRAAWLPAWAPRYPLYILLNASAVLAIIIGILRWRPAHVMPWCLLAFGQASYTVGDFLFYRALYITHSNSSPSLADVFYLGSGPIHGGWPRSHRPPPQRA